MISIAEEILKNTGGDTRASSASSSFTFKSQPAYEEKEKNVMNKESPILKNS